MKKVRLVYLLWVLAISINATAQDRESQGEASVYPIKKYGKKTLSGEYLSSRFLVASHNYLPIGSIVEVTNLTNKRTATVRIIDQGTSNPAHIIEISHSAAQALGMIGGDIRNVKLLVLLSGEKPAVQTVSNRETTTVPSTEPKVKKEPEFPMDFPVHEKIRVDTTGGKWKIIKQ